MIALIIVGGLVIAAMVGAHVLLQQRLAGTLRAVLVEHEAEESARRVAVYKQQKAATRDVSRDVGELVGTVRHLHEDAKLMHQRTDALARDVKAAR